MSRITQLNYLVYLCILRYSSNDFISSKIIKSQINRNSQLRAFWQKTDPNPESRTITRSGADLLNLTATNILENFLTLFYFFIKKTDPDPSKIPNPSGSRQNYSDKMRTIKYDESKLILFSL